MSTTDFTLSWYHWDAKECPIVEFHSSNLKNSLSQDPTVWMAFLNTTYVWVALLVILNTSPMVEILWPCVCNKRILLPADIWEESCISTSWKIKILSFFLSFFHENNVLQEALEQCISRILHQIAVLMNSTKMIYFVFTTQKSESSEWSECLNDTLQAPDKLSFQEEMSRVPKQQPR